MKGSNDGFYEEKKSNDLKKAQMTNASQKMKPIGF